MAREDHSRRISKYPPPGVDARAPNIARVYDAFLGGKDNFAADRQVVDSVLRVSPDAAGIARTNRAFLRRVVRYLAGEAGMTQLLDIGSGLPTAGNVHEVAREINPVGAHHLRRQRPGGARPRAGVAGRRPDHRGGGRGSAAASGDPRAPGHPEIPRLRPADRPAAARGHAPRGGRGRPGRDHGRAAGRPAPGQLPGHLQLRPAGAGIPRRAGHGPGGGTDPARPARYRALAGRRGGQGLVRRLDARRAGPGPAGAGGFLPADPEA